MTHSTIEQARNLTLQKIGRNLVSLQKLEGMLKRLLVSAGQSGYLSDFQAGWEKRTQRVSSMTMGQVVREASDAIFGEPEIAQGRLEFSPDPWIASSFRIEGGQAAAAAWKAELDAIVAERNELVHHLLVGFDPDSLEACKALGATLDVQREKMIPVVERIRELVIGLKEGQAEIAEQLRMMLDQGQA